MVITFYEEEDFDLYVNVANLQEADYIISIRSLLTKDELYRLEMELIETNDRYTHFNVCAPQSIKNDIDGIYEYYIMIDDVEVEDDLLQVVDYGMVRLINKNYNVTVPVFKSANDESKARVLYRPKD